MEVDEVAKAEGKRTISTRSEEVASLNQLSNPKSSKGCMLKVWSGGVLKRETCPTGVTGFAAGVEVGAAGGGGEDGGVTAGSGGIFWLNKGETKG